MKMNKNKLTNLLKVGILFFCTSIFLWNCESSEIKESLEHKLPNLKKVDLSKNSSISDFVKNQTKGSYQNRTITSTIGEINLEEALHYIDSLGINSYSLLLNNQSLTNPLDFENLFIIDNNQENYKIFILRYEPDFEWIKQNNFKFSFNSFTGILKHFDVNHNLIFENSYLNGEIINNYQSRTSNNCHPGFWREESACSGIPWDCGGDPEFCGTRTVFEEADESGCGGGFEGGNDNETPNDENNTGGGSDGTYTPWIPDPYNSVIPNPLVKPQYLSEVEILNFELSYNSPFKIDVTQVLDSIALPANDSTKIANQKFLCLYNKLTTSNSYKNLFTNIFGEDQDVLNVEFKITKNLKNSNGERKNGLRTVIKEESQKNSSTGEIIKLKQLIQIDQDLLTGNSNYNAIKTIIHESIHAFLTLKKLTCNSQAALDSYNNDDISETINTLYNNFCTSNQNQHDFMFNNMLPIFKTIFEEIRKLNFTSQASLDGLSTYDLQVLNQLIGTNVPNSHIFNWDEFYLYSSVHGLEKTSSFINEIQNDPEKNEVFKAYKYLGETLSKNCN